MNALFAQLKTLTEKENGAPFVEPDAMPTLVPPDTLRSRARVAFNRLQRSMHR